MAPSVKAIRLHFGLSKEAIGAIASETLKAGGWVEPSTTPASLVDPPEPKIGTIMPDGTSFAGLSPDSGKPMYAAPADAPLAMTFSEAQQYAANLDAHGHR